LTTSVKKIPNVALVIADPLSKKFRQGVPPLMQVINIAVKKNINVNDSQNLAFVIELLLFDYLSNQKQKNAFQEE
jgi:hypothetical protein